MKEADRKKLVAAAIAKRDAIKRNTCFDPYKIDSKPSPKQEAPLLDRLKLIIYVIAGNQSGKSTIGARRTAWMFTETDPYWKRPNAHACNMCDSTNFEKVVVERDGVVHESENFNCLDCGHFWVDWADEPLLIIVAGRTTGQLDKLWKTKIKPYLPKDSYDKPKKQGGVIQEVVNRKNGNTIIFTSHDKAKEAAEKVQSYVAHFVWLDEMPGDANYIEELHRRCDSRRAQFLATFTPKSRNEAVREMVDNVDPDIGIKYQMGKLDNPIYWGREEEERKKIAHLPLERQLTILEGAWERSSSTVFYLDKLTHIDRLPPTYSPNWPHVVSTDPAAAGKAGFILAARDPSNGFWWIVKAMYLEGKAPSDLVEEIEKLIMPFNVVRRIYDPHETGFMKEAVKLKITYMGVWNKTQRKKELITNVQQALSDGWLQFNENLFEMYTELNNAEWNNDETGIKRSTKYHLVDALQYLVDNLPEKPKEVQVLSRDAKLMRAARAQRLAEETARQWSDAFDTRKRRKRFKSKPSSGGRRKWGNVGI